jgi:type IV secretory pathway TrbF-like protein
METPRTPTPFLDARIQWADRVERAFSGQRVGLIVGCAGMFIGAASLAGYMQLAAQPRFVPYVFSIDSSGRTQVLGPATRSGLYEQRALRTFLADWVHDARSITQDEALQDLQIRRVYSMLRVNDEAKRKMDEYWDPEKADRWPKSRAQNETVDAEVETPQPLTGGTWQAYWREITRASDGSVKSDRRMRATLQVYQVPETDPRDQVTLLQNPLGIYVQDFDIQEVPNP